MTETSKEQSDSGIASNDIAAWQELLSVVIPKLFRLFMERWPNPSLAEELVQKTVFDAVRGRQGYDPAKGGIDAWIFGIAYNHIRLELRRRASRHGFTGDIAKYLEVIDKKLLPDEVLEQQETAQQVRTALNSLDGKECAVLKARYLEDVPIREIAKQMNITKKAVYNLLYRAGLSFRQKLSEKSSRNSLGDDYGK